MEKGVLKTWTPGQELEFEERIKRCRTFAERCLLMTTRDLLKYDGRSKAGKRGIAQGLLRLAVATDKDLEELAKLEASVQVEDPGQIPGLSRFAFEQERLEVLKKVRAEIREKGIKGSELECQ
ncbi:hypothetical protein ES703_107656 [subsurface metagenome]